MEMGNINASVDLRRDGEIAIITADNPPVNALKHEVRAGLADALRQTGEDAAVKGVVIACAGRTFFAGADITEFGKPPTEPSLHSVLDLIESSPKPVVSAIHGTALGGGLEVTLACHYRVGVKSARFGLPEVKLGILPGAGGTQRLPRVVGPQKALQMIVSGDPIGADEALRVGLIDEIVAGGAAAEGKATTSGDDLAAAGDAASLELDLSVRDRAAVEQREAAGEARRGWRRRGRRGPRGRPRRGSRRTGAARRGERERRARGQRRQPLHPTANARELVIHRQTAST